MNPSPWRRLAAAAAILLVLGACTTAVSPSPSGSSSLPQPSSSGTPSPIPSGSPQPGELSQADLKYRVIDRFAPLWFCDPDLYPVAVGDEQELARERLPEIQADAPTYRAILDRLDLDRNAQPNDAQTLAIYRDWKLLNALVLEPVAGGFRFDATFGEEGDAQGRHVAGEISADGEIVVAVDEASGPPSCPICLTRGTLIATPEGAVRVEDIRIGMTVWSVDTQGRRVAVTVRSVGSTPVPVAHRVVRLTLADGRILSASPGHPLADGRLLGGVQIGDSVDGVAVVSARLVRYAGGRTFDLLPSGPTGIYWANGVPLGSTLPR